jgi:glycosyltransferase involved in cell wall biosynthesis
MVKQVESLDAEVTVIPAGRVRDARRAVATSRRLGAELRRTRSDVVVSWMSKAHLYTSPAASVLRIPAFWFQHGLPKPTDPIDRLATLAPAIAVFAPSRTVAAAQEAIWPRRRTRVVYPGIDARDAPPPSREVRARTLSSLGIPEDATVVGMVGRLQRWKGMHVLVEAMPELLARFPKLHVVIVGGDHPLEPGYREDLEARSTALRVADRLHLAGYRPDGVRWMNMFDVVVHASDSEPFGLVVLEAMALGKPLVAGAEGGPAEIVRDGVDGFLVPYGDVATLGDRVSRYLADPELAARTGRAAAEHARAFSPSRFADEVVAELRAHRGNVA